MFSFSIHLDNFWGFRSKPKAHKLFLLVFIYRVLIFLGLEDFPTLELVHITGPYSSLFFLQRQA